MFQYQSLRDIEQILELFEVGVPEYFQNSIVIWCEMNRGLSTWIISDRRYLEKVFWNLRQKLHLAEEAPVLDLKTNVLIWDLILWNSNFALSIWLSSPRTSFLTLHETELWSNSWRPGLLEAPASFGEVCCAQEVPWHQTHRSRLHHCSNFSSPALLSSLGPDTMLSVRKKMAAGKHREIFDVRPSKTMIPFITCKKLPLASMSASWFLIWIWCPNWLSSNHQSSATLQVLDTCLIVGLLPLMIILITASLSSKDVQLRLALTRLCVCGDAVHMWQLINISVSLVFGFGFVISRAVSCCTMGWCFGSLRWT